jgi:uncharacterized protein (TIGR03437 family)
VFEANRGQTDSRVKFLSRGSGYTMFFTATETVLSMPGGDAVRMKLEGGSPKPVVEGLETLPGHSSYFLGNDPAKWRTRVPQYARVRYREAYPGIDVVFYGNQRQIESDFVVQPGADPSTIRLAFDGCDKLEVDSEGDLMMRTAGGDLRFARPRVYQESGGQQDEVAGGYLLLGPRTVGFTLGEYDPSRTLVIDPIVYSTLLGGSGADLATKIAVDARGLAYVTGFADSADFPAILGTPGPGVHGIRRVFVAKFNPSGSQLVYSVLLGGSGSESGLGIAVDTAGSVYVSGSTSSPDFPRTPGAYDAFRGNKAGFVVKLNPSGTGLLYSALLGGAGQYWAGPLAVDAAGNAYVTAGDAAPNDPSDFPTTAAFGTGQGVMRLVKLNATGSALLYSVLVRGGYAASIAVDEFGSAYIAGGAEAGLPTTPDALHLSPPPTGYVDGFVTKLNPEGTELAYSTFLRLLSGYTSEVAVDGAGNAYVSTTTDVPSSARVVRLNAAGSSLIYSANAGPVYSDINDLSAIDLALAPSGEVWVSRVSPGAFVEISKLNAAGSAVVAHTSLFGTGVVYGAPEIRQSCSGDVYLAGLFLGSNVHTVVPAFPATPGAFQPQLRGPADAFLVRFRPDAVTPPACTLHAATLRPGAPVAPESFTSLFGEGLAASTQVASAPQPSLAGVTIHVRDSQGVERQALLYYASANQINYLIPASTAPGPAIVSVTAAGEVVAVTAIEIAPVAPGIFAANANGYGPAAALAVHVRPGGVQTTQFTFECPHQLCVSTPIDWGDAGDQVVLVLFGTGIRGRNLLAPVSATVGGEPVIVQYAGPQNEFEGLDQVNLLLPRTLAGRGEADVNLWVDGRLANAVSIWLQ